MVSLKLFQYLPCTYSYCCSPTLSKTLSKVKASILIPAWLFELCAFRHPALCFNRHHKRPYKRWRKEAAAFHGLVVVLPTPSSRAWPWSWTAKAAAINGNWGEEGKGRRARTAQCGPGSTLACQATSILKSHYDTEWRGQGCCCLPSLSASVVL